MNLSDTITLRETDKTRVTPAPESGIADVLHPARATITLSAAEIEQLDQRIDAACGRIAPLWPLQHFVAVNPFFGLRDQSFQDASDTLARILGTSLYMSRDYYRAQRLDGRISDQDLAAAIAREGSHLSVAEVDRVLATKAPRPRMGMAPVSEVLERVEGGLWSSFVTERISLHCAAYFDLGQAMVRMPWRDRSLYQSWLSAAAIDRSPAMMGLHQFRDEVARLPQDPRAAIGWALQELEIPDGAVERYLHASLLSIGGWAAWTRYLRWQAELHHERDDSMVDLLAIRLMWDVLLFREKSSAALVAQWREMLEASMRAPSAKRQAAAEIDRIMLGAAEFGFQRTLIEEFQTSSATSDESATRPAVQAAFCIDVRSEVFRRSLETVAPGVQTLGFAGFFGIFIEYVPLGADQGRSHVPVIFNPAYTICEQSDTGADDQDAGLAERRRQRIGLSKAWKHFKFSAASCFSFVEAAGLMYAPKLLSDSLGWTRPVPDPATQGLDANARNRLRPSLETASAHACCGEHDHSGIPAAERVDHAERILHAMAMTGNFARLVMLAGHGASTVNNPHATALDCGACAGQTGEASARVVAALLNDAGVRQGLRARGIEIPEDTWFIAALHDTTTDAVQLFDIDQVPAMLADDLSRLQQWLEQAGNLTRMQRATLLGTAGKTDEAVHADVQQRSRDWSQVRPEWALANNAAFIAAPRRRTRHMDLQGRAFLHEYVWQDDTEFRILELIMTAPMVVANWINMQYYGSVVDNQHFGSGNKVLHNVVGGAIGVLEGNGGDLRTGLSLQSLHDGKQWVHEPLRLSVFIEAPQAAMDAVIAEHELVRELVDNGWLHLFRIAGDGSVYRREEHARWALWQAG